MELRWLDDFCALARTRHFSRAADERHVSQPTFSRRIKLLEEEMGVILIDRHSLPMQLTPAGEVFLISCTDISARLRLTKSQCKAVDQQQQDQVSLATSQSLLISFLPQWRKQLTQKAAAKASSEASLNTHLGESLEINLASSNWLGTEYCQALLQGECDLLMSYWHPAMQLDTEFNDDEVEFIRLGQDQLLPVSAKSTLDTPLFNLSDHGLNQPNQIPYIAYQPQTFLSQVIQAQVQPLFPSQLVVVNENSQAVSSKALIQQGFGLGWLPKSLITTELEQNFLCIAGNIEWHISLDIRLYRRRNNPSLKLKALWELLREH
jgi:DNA-binding transcriptional LysR family regulator